MKFKEIVSYYRMKENDNLRHSNKILSTPEATTDQQNVESETVTNARSSESTSNDPEQDEVLLNRVKTCPKSAASQPSANQSPMKGNPTAENTLGTSSNATTNDKNDLQYKNTEELVMEGVISHNINRYRLHNQAAYGELLYSIRWFGYGPLDDTWEPTTHLARSK